jgi:hypothetical protein
MVTKKAVRDAFEKDGAYTLIKDLFRHILEIKKGYRYNDIGSEEICQFIKYASFDEKKVSDTFFSPTKAPVYNTMIVGRYKNIELAIVRCGEGSGFFSIAPDHYIELSFANELVCAFNIDTWGSTDITVYKRGEWLSIIKNENSLIRRDIDKSHFKILQDQDQQLGDENYKL